jgi:hypothetical protein
MPARRFRLGPDLDARRRLGLLIELGELELSLGDRPQILPGEGRVDALAQMLAVKSNAAAEHVGTHFHRLDHA